MNKPPFLILLLFAALLITSYQPGLLLTQDVQAAGSEAAISATATPASSGLQGLLSAAGTLPPLVIDRKPGSSEEALLDSAIELVFDRPMDQSATQAAFQLSGPDNTQLKGSFSWPDPTHLRFQPSLKLQPGQTYQVTLSEKAAAADKVPLNSPYSFRFSTLTPLQVGQVFPAPDSNQVDAGTRITVLFTRPVVALGIVEDQHKLAQPLIFTPKVSGEGEWINTSTYVFTPNPPLQSNTRYTVRILAGLADASANPAAALPKDYSWSFVTLPPTLQVVQIGTSMIEPAGLYSPKDIPLIPTITITFHQAMDQAATVAAVKLSGPDGAVYPLRAEWNKTGDAVTVKPARVLVPGKVYTLLVSTAAKALNGGSLDKEFKTTFTSVNLPAVISTDPPDGCNACKVFNGQFVITFASPMNLKSVTSRVIFKPELITQESYWYNDNDHTLTYFGLQALTRYEVTLQPGMVDLYGNAINTGKTISFTTGPLTPSLQLMMPFETIFRSKGTQEFYFRYANLKNVNFTLYQINAQEYIRLREKGFDLSKYSPGEGSIYRQFTVNTEAQRDNYLLKEVNLSGKQNELVPPGFYYLGLDSPDIPHQGKFLDARFLVVASANLTFKTSPNDALLWVTGFEDGRPIAGVPLSIYNTSNEKIASGKSGADGLLHLELPASTEDFSSHYALSDGGDVFVVANDNWGAGASPEDFGIWGQYYGASRPASAYLYTDRPIYRPGQSVYFKGIVRMDDDLTYSLPENAEAEVIIRSFDKEIYNEWLPLSSFGSFNGELKLDSDAALGAYTITVKLRGVTNDVSSLGFTVAEYRRPEFLVETTSDPNDLLGGQSFTATVSARYYAGGGVSGADVAWTLRSEPFFFNPPDSFSGYSFQDDTPDATSFGNQPAVDRNQVVAEGKGLTDENGKLVVRLPADISKQTTSQRLTLEATVTDFSGFAVSGRTAVNAHKSLVYAGIKARQYVGLVGEEQTFDLAALDWAGKPTAGQKVDVTISERQWYSVQEQDAQGNLRWTSSVKDIPVQTNRAVTIDEQGKAKVSFIPAKGGIYRARVTASDRNGNLSAAAATLWVSGPEYIPWRQTNDRTFQLVADRESYKPGDTAEILIASPYQGDVYALVTVERGRVRGQEVIRLTSNSTVYKLPISKEMAPVVYMSVMVVKGIDDTNPRPGFKIGMAKLNVSTDQQALKVQVTADKKEAGPGDQVTYSVLATSLDGKPVKAELSLGLSDLATLSLVDPNSMPILDYFYAPRALSVRTASSLTLNIEEYNAQVQKLAEVTGRGGGSGGGKGGGALGVPEVRQNFPDTAYWKADILTDENGRATVTITLPDNLTTWRMDARAATLATQVGQTTTDLISTKPLLVRPQTPRFFIAGDQALLGAAVHNNTKEDLQVQVTLDAKGVKLTTPVSQAIELRAGQQAFLSWPASIPLDAQRVDLVFSAKGGAYSDASRPTLGTLDNNGIPVYRYEAPETVGTAGELDTTGTRTEVVRLPEEFPVTQGDLKVKIEPSLAAAMTDGLNYLKNYPYECIEQTVSRFLPNVLTTQAMKAAGVNNPPLEESLRQQVSTSLQRLYNAQNSNGGWGWWKGDDSQETVSAYVVLGMLEARKAGYAVDVDSLSRGTSYLNRQVVTLFQDKQNYARGGRNRQAFVLYVLARAGAPDVSHTVQLYDSRQELALYARGFLAQTLAVIDPKDPRLNNLRSDLVNQAILSATGAHWQEKSPDYWNWNTDTRSTAILLDTLIKIDPQNGLSANAVRWLMSNRENGYWKSTQETAWTLMALTDWMVQSGELKADYQYALALNGKQLLQGQADARSLRDVKELQVAVSELLQGQPNALQIAREGDSGKLYYTTRLNVFLPVPEIKALNQGITISRRYYTLKDTRTPVTTAAQGDVLLARMTLVVPDTKHYLLVEDPLPAGLEAVDTSLKTSQQGLMPDTFDWSAVNESGWGWWFFRHIELRDEKVVLSTETLPAGTYVYTYLVRASTPGTFNVIPPTAQELYFPEVYGRGEGSQFVVKP